MKYPFAEMCKRKIKIHSERLLIFEKSFTLSAGNIEYANENRRIRHCARAPCSNNKITENSIRMLSDC